MVMVGVARPGLNSCASILCAWGTLGAVTDLRATYTDGTGRDAHQWHVLPCVRPPACVRSRQIPLPLPLGAAMYPRRRF